MNRWRKGIASWRCGDTFYLSVPFTWLLGEAEAIAQGFRHALKTARIVVGGPAVKLMGAPWADDAPGETPFDVLAMHNPCATFTTRGCPNKCGFCAVPKIEGAFRELPTWKPAPIVCDNNLLCASRSHFERVVESLKPFQACDFNQGLDAELFTAWHAEKLATLKRPSIRFAFDHVSDEPKLAQAIQSARSAGLKTLSAYVLFGFRDTPEDAQYRCDWLSTQGVNPCPMRYQPLDATEKNSWSPPAWEGWNMSRFAKWYYRNRFLRDTPLRDYATADAPRRGLFG